MTMKFGINVSIHRLWLQNHEARFLISFSNLNYVAKFPNWSVAGNHGNRIKISAYGFVRTILINPLPEYGKHAMFRFVVTFIPVFSQ